MQSDIREGEKGGVKGRVRSSIRERIAELVAAGAVRVPEIALFPLSQAAEAHRISEGRHLRGKLVFQVR